MKPDHVPAFQRFDNRFRIATAAPKGSRPSSYPDHTVPGTHFSLLVWPVADMSCVVGANSQHCPTVAHLKKREINGNTGVVNLVGSPNCHRATTAPGQLVVIQPEGD
jgi:hypothetical protein